MILPTPGASFEWRTTSGGMALVCPELEPYAVHIFTTRGWSLGSATTETNDRPAWKEVADALVLDVGHLVRLRQVHGHAFVVASPNRNSTSADIIVSNDSSIGVAVQTADCVPLLIADPTTGAVAAAHAGWRGLAARAPQSAIHALVDTYGSRPSDLLIAAGPSIGACCYEVGRDVWDAFEAAGFSPDDFDRWFLERSAVSPPNPSMPRVSPTARPDHWFFDGWASTVDQLIDEGVPSRQIFSAGLCTASHPTVFCSYRRDGAPAGRMVGAIKPRRPRP